MEDKESDSDGPLIDDNVVRIQLRKPSHRKWELRTRNLSPGIKFPTIQLFDCEGNLLVETNDENISIKSSDYEGHSLRNTQSLREKDFRHIIKKNGLRKHKSVAGDKIYTRVYRTPVILNESNQNDNYSYVIKTSDSVSNIPKNLTVNNNHFLNLDSAENSPLYSDAHSALSSLKSSDNESETENSQTNKCCIQRINCDSVFNSPQLEPIVIERSINCSKEVTLKNSQSFKDCVHSSIGVKRGLQRSKSSFSYKQPKYKVPFIKTYMKSLPNRSNAWAEWIAEERKTSFNNSQLPISSRRNSVEVSNKKLSKCNLQDNSLEDLFNVPTDVAAACELKKRLKLYRRGISETESRQRWAGELSDRRHSETAMTRITQTSSSESIDEADLVLSRLKRRIIKNKVRERKGSNGCQRKRKQSDRTSSGEGWQDVAEAFTRHAAQVRDRGAMGSNISQHSAKGLKGRRARSSGDLCNGDTKSQSESSVCGSVVGDVLGWNRSLPNHLDGNRHLADYSRVNNNYGDFGVVTYNRCHPKGGRGLRYRIFKTGSDAEPVWKLQDPGCDQGYGSERSPEDDYVAPIRPPISLEEYEGQLRAIYPFINDDNTFTVVVEKDGRGLGMSVCGAGGLVRIRRLYPPQPAWRTGQLASRDLLLSANGVPLAGLTTYEALEVLRTAAPRVELRVCRPPPDMLESVTPPDPPTPPVRTPLPPHLPPLDPLNCHPMHARLSATTSSATTSSSEGRGRREGSPDERRELHLPGLDRPMPIYDVQFGEFDIIMTKVNGSLGFTLRKEDHSALGHYVRALVREPALSDGRIQPGDRIVAVNDTPMSNMSHAEAVAFLRSCGSEVRLRLYRDHAATPLSPVSPKEDPTDSDVPFNKPKPHLRPEAVSMLCDLAARRMTPDTVDGSRSPCLSPRKFRKLTKENHYEQPNDFSTPKKLVSTYKKVHYQTLERRRSKSEQDIRPQVKDHSMTSPVSGYVRKSKLSLTVPPHGFELNNLDNDTLDAPNLYQESQQRYSELQFESNEPVSMPVDLSSDEGKFKHSNPVYQSAVLHTTSSETGGNTNSSGYKEDGLKKWKGVTVTLSPENERKSFNQKPVEKDNEQKENIKPEPASMDTNISGEPTIMTVELNRGWNSRLGFSVQSHPESGQSYISAVYSDSVAARDGRLRQGDVILQVNDENVTSMKTPEVIDLLRILRGSICITVLRPPNSH